MKGGNSLKIVIRTMTNMSFDEINEITKLLPEQSKIVGDLKEMEDRLGYKSVIRWALENTPNKFADYCELIDGRYDGPLARHFELAIKLEDTIFAQSRHAAGVVISRLPLIKVCPLIHDDSGNVIAGFEMDDLADIGLPKFDILGLKLLDKISVVRDRINGTNTVCSA
jgi:DNA polymerase III alpha subunit